MIGAFVAAWGAHHLLSQRRLGYDRWQSVIEAQRRADEARKEADAAREAADEARRAFPRRVIDPTGRKRMVPNGFGLVDGALSILEQQRPTPDREFRQRNTNRLDMHPRSRR